MSKKKREKHEQVENGQDAQNDRNGEETDVPAQAPEEILSKTQHTVTINDEEIAYTATAGTMVLKEEDEESGEKPKASVFFIAYTKNGVGDLGERPITFSFNGGPGSSSVWLHLGVLGPRRVQMGDVGDLLPPPYRLVNNEHSLLDETDLVFVDPVSTGYSRPVPGEKAEQFHSVEEDVKSVGEFIRLYTTRFGRWTSPKFLIGESYGTTRAAGLSGFLQGRHGMYLNGVMLVSSILNFQSAHFDPGNDLPSILFLPTYTATAWYHRRLPDDLQANLHATLAEVKAFAAGEYTLALMQGSTLPDDERRQIVQKLARYTGLSEAYIEQTNLRINIYRFVKELLRDQRRTVGRLDTRFTGIDRDAAGEHFDFDPSYAAIQGPYTATLNDYVRRDLAFENDLPYEILTSLYEKWDYGKYKNQYVNVAETLREAMTQNPFLKVFVANGYYDLATPYFATEYTFNHLGIDPSLQENVSMAYYEAGHMMYVHEPSLAQLKEDLADFLRSAI
ncbi:MAG TPA: peptidase S10 [Chloroflexi bacterium]|nr:peptidase S10 [Chloroflexota bacterium]